MDYSEFMNSKEITSLCAQFSRAYGLNTVSKNSFAFYLFGCSEERTYACLKKMGLLYCKAFFFKKTLKDFLKIDIETENNEKDCLINEKDEEVLSQNNEKKTYPKRIIFYDTNTEIKNDILKLINENKIFYLSPNADSELYDFVYEEEENQNKIRNCNISDEKKNFSGFNLVVGGLVDRSVKKDASLLKAKELEIIPKRLPLNIIHEIEEIEDCTLNLNQPLNIDNIIEILHVYLEYEYSWKEALKRHFSKRIKNKIVNK